MAKKLAQRMLDLGANLFHKVGLGDYQHDFGFEAEFDPWLEELWKNLQPFFPTGFKPPTEGVLPSIYTVRLEPNVADSTLAFLPIPYGAINEVYLAELQEKERITALDHFQNTLRLKIKQDVDYSPGDTILVQPANDSKLVNDFLKTINLDPEAALEIEADPSLAGQVSSASLIKFPPRISARELFTWWLNLSEPPSRHFCSVLAHFHKLSAKDSKEKDIRVSKLSEFASKTADGKSEYFRYCVRERRNMLEVFQDFHIGDTIPLPYLIQGLGKQRPREFSISSFGVGEVELTVAITEYTTKFKRQVLGVCSSFFMSRSVGERIPTWLKKGTMTFPKDKPLIFVGPGTGVAPFRSAIQALKGTGQKLVLIFGCRSEQSDFYYKHEWEALQSQGVPLTVFTAFSRDSEAKVYVQHKIREHGALLRSLILDEQAHIYVSGRAKNMPKSVLKAFTEIVGDEGAAVIDSMKKNGRYQVEVW